MEPKKRMIHVLLKPAILFAPDNLWHQPLAKIGRLVTVRPCPQGRHHIRWLHLLEFTPPYKPRSSQWS